MSADKAAEHRIVPTVRAVHGVNELQPPLTEWLRHRFSDPALSIVSLSSPGAAGVNNETLILDVQSSAPELEGIAGLVVRLEAATTLFPAVDVAVQYKMYAAMAREPSVPGPRVFGFEQDVGVLGRRFFVMEKLAGLIPADNPSYHQLGWVADLGEADRSALWADAIGVMAQMHRLPTAHFAFLRDHGLGGPEQQIAAARAYFDGARAGRDYPLLERAWEWLRTNQPRHLPEGFSWGDARCVNMVFQGTRCVGVLDWDMVSLAGAEADLTWWMLHDWVGSAGVGRLSGLAGPAETVRLWEAAAGREARNLEFWMMYNLFRLGAIMILLKQFLAEGGTPAEAIADIDWRNPGMSVLQSRFGEGEPLGLGTWADIWPGS